MTRRQSISMRQLQRATSAAGPSATAEEIAKHYLSPTLARYYGSVCDTTFLQKITDAAQEKADCLRQGVSPPSSGDITTMASASTQYKRWEVLSGWAALVSMSLACGLLAKSVGIDRWWFGLAMPFLGPGVPAYLIGSNIGQSIYRTTRTFAEAAAIGAVTLAYERTRADYWLSLSWRDLELQVAALFTRLGYTARATPGTNDKGVDVVAMNRNEKVVVQCKQYSKRAQRRVVSELLGVMTSERADRGILVCTGGFTPGAEDYAAQNGVELWNVADLVRVNDEIMAKLTDNQRMHARGPSHL